MSAFRSLELAIDMAVRQRDAQARKLAQAVRNRDFAQQQMAQLQGYADETDARWGRGQSATLSTEMLHHHYQFRDRLQQAVHMQEGVIANLQTQRDAAHRDLLNAEYKLASLRQVLAHRQAAALQVQHRRDQRTMDEFAAQRHARLAAERLTGEPL